MTPTGLGLTLCGYKADTPLMTSFLDRISAFLAGRRTEVEVLLLVQTVRGQAAVPVRRRLR